MSEYRTDRPVRAMIEHNCFGCGAANPIGLHLEFFMMDEDSVWAEWTPTSAYEGYGGMIHGGIICTLLDEIMAWSLYARDTWAVTAKLQTSFRKPVHVGEPVRLVGKVMRDRGRILEIHGEIRLVEDNSLLAEGESTFVRVPENQAQQWNDRYLTNRGE